MNWVAKQSVAGATASLDLGLFREAVFKSEFAVYVMRFDANGAATFEEANDTVLALAGRPLAQVVGQRPIDCLPPEIGDCLEELDETRYWLELLLESEILPRAKANPLLQETDELLAIFTTISKNTKAGDEE